jgi:hypothetical protein
MSGSFLCPVCAYSGLEHPPQDFTICPCCGTEFGLDDFTMLPEGLQVIWKELRRAWLDRGAQWFDPGTLPPPGWNPYAQLWETRNTRAVTPSFSGASRNSRADIVLNGWALVNA